MFATVKSLATFCKFESFNVSAYFITVVTLFFSWTCYVSICHPKYETNKEKNICFTFLFEYPTKDWPDLFLMMPGGQPKESIGKETKASF